MWYSEFLTFTLSQLALAAPFLPWSIVLNEYTIDPTCVLYTHFQLKPWGTACGYTVYFANIKILHLLTGVFTQLMMLFIIFWGTRRDVMVVGGLFALVLSVLILSEYSNEINISMTPPLKYLMARGPGYLVQLLTAAYGGAIFSFEFYLHFYTSKTRTPPTDMILKCAAFLLSSLSVLSAFGDLVKIDSCPDMVSVFDTSRCPPVDNTMLAVFTCGNVLSAVALYQMIAFLKVTKRRWLINSVAIVTILSSGGQIAGAVLMKNREHLGWAVYTSAAGAVMGLIFLGVYNQVLVGHSLDTR